VATVDEDCAQKPSRKGIMRKKKKEPILIFSEIEQYVALELAI
jgi:hypothetical protein